MLRKQTLTSRFWKLESGCMLCLLNYSQEMAVSSSEGDLVLLYLLNISKY